MKTKDFIAKWYGVADGEEKRCSSVFKNGKGNIYSYGYHYPLLFDIAGITFRNVKGYSTSTANHISWCWGVEHEDIIWDLHLIDGGFTPSNAITCLRAEENELMLQQDKGREGTFAYEHRHNRLIKISFTLAKLYRAEITFSEPSVDTIGF